MGIEIRFRGLASYPAAPDTVIQIDQRVAVIYGDNGTGKSTIARALRQFAGGAGSHAVSLLSPQIKNPELCIYDVDYVEDNFHSKERFRGIFTLGEKSALEMGRIAELELAQVEAEKNRLDLDTQITSLAYAIQRRSAEAAEVTWSIKKDYEKGPLRYCLEDRKLRGDKSKLLTFIRAFPHDPPTRQIEDLLREAAEVEDETASEKLVLPLLPEGIDDIERSRLFGMVIAGSGSSALAPLIEQLSSEAWVREGRAFVAADSNQCPFCQQALPAHFHEEFTKLFDEAYERSLAQLAQSREAYANRILAISELLGTAPFLDEYVEADPAFQKSTRSLMTIVESNLKLLDQKLRDPAIQIEVPSSLSIREEWNAHANRINEQILRYNARILDRVHVKRQLDLEFWRLIKAQYSIPLAQIDSHVSELLGKQDAAKSERQKWDVASSENALELLRLRSAATNIDVAVAAINRRIQNIGIKGFLIEKSEDHEGFYQIVRGSNKKVSYKSLSEGERTLITFLYFLESLEGSTDSSGNSNKSNRLIIVDDPVSSLSHNHIYDIAALVTTRLVDRKEFPLVLILTHSLFFFHELIKLRGHHKYQFMRVLKQDHSTICALNPDDIKNDYQAFWLVLKEAMTHQQYSVAIPISMRYILEHYFSFIGTSAKLTKALEDLGESDQNYRAFYRYINRQSHADEINISDLPSIDPSTYLAKFRQVFVDTNQLEHYDRMLGLKSSEAGQVAETA